MGIRASRFNYQYTKLGRFAALFTARSDTDLSEWWQIYDWTIRQTSDVQSSGRCFTMMPYKISGVAAGRTPQFIEMIRFDVHRNSGSARLPGSLAIFRGCLSFVFFQRWDFHQRPFCIRLMHGLAVVPTSLLRESFRPARFRSREAHRVILQCTSSPFNPNARVHLETVLRPTTSLSRKAASVSPSPRFCGVTGAKWGEISPKEFAH